MDFDRERLLSQTFVELADTLVTGFDVVDFVHVLIDRCVDVLGASAAGLMLVDNRAGLQVMASSDDRAHLLELFQLQSHEGPCLDCHRSGRPIVAEDLEVEDRRWPTFAPEARAAGFRSVNAIPMRLREDVIGALNLFSTDAGGLLEADTRAAQAMADVATIGILHQRAAVDTRVTMEQLQTALNSRVIIEQAKGLLAERVKVDLDQAFRLLRGHARAGNRRLTDVAADLLEGRLSSDVFEGREDRAAGGSSRAGSGPHPSAFR